MRTHDPPISCRPTGTLASMPVTKLPSKRKSNQQRVQPRLVIRSSDIHAAGCYTLDPIAKGSQIAEYDGPRIPKAVADERYGGRPVTYLFGFGEEGDVIDGFGTAMFINHSCSANCESEEREERIFISATRDIKAGEELVYDYHLYDSDLDDEAPCHCGSPGCRGTMYSEAELTRRAKLLKRRESKTATRA